MDSTPSDSPAEPRPEPVGSETPDAEAAALRAENEELRRRNAELAAGTAPAHTGGWKDVLRSILVVVLIVLGALCATLSVPAIWSRNLVLNTDRYVETMTPLASNPGIQAAVIKAVDAEFAANVDIKGLVESVLPPRAAPLAGPIENAANSLVNTIATRFVESDAFKTLWEAINRTAHKSLVAILTGSPPGGDSSALEVDKGILTVNLAPVINAVKKQLVSAGLTVAQNVPAVGTTIEIAKVQGVHEARGYVKLLNKVADWLPLIALAFFVLAVVAAHRRRRAIVASALSIAGGMLVLAIALAIGRSVYINALPLKYLDENSAGELFDTIVRFLRAGLRLVLVVALLICLAVWMTGSSRQARGLRSGTVSLSRRATAHWKDSPFSVFVAANHTFISVAIAALGALVLVLWTNPSAVTVVVIIIITGILVLLANSFKPSRGEPA